MNLGRESITFQMNLCSRPMGAGRSGAPRPAAAGAVGSRRDVVRGPRVWPRYLQQEQTGTDEYETALCALRAWWHAAANGAIHMRSPPRATCVMHEVLEAREGGGCVWKAGDG